MDNKRVLMGILFLNAFLLGFLVIFWFREIWMVEEHPNILIETPVEIPGPAPVPASTPTPMPEPDFPVVTTVNSADTDNRIEEFLEKHNLLMIDLKATVKECADSVLAITPNYDFIDPEHQIFKNKSELRELAHTMIDKGVGRSPFEFVAMGGLRNALQDGVELEPDWISSFWNELPTCRNDKGVLFIETLFEAMMKRKYSNEFVEGIFRHLKHNLIPDEESLTHPDDHILLLTLLLKASAVGVLGNEYQPDINNQLDLVLKERSELSNFLNSDASDYAKREAFLNYMKLWGDRTSDLRNLTNEMIVNRPPIESD